MLRLKAVIAGSFIVLCSLFVMSLGTVAAQQQQVTTDIQNGLCSGANLQFTANPSSCQQDRSAIARVNSIIRRIVNLLSVLVGVVAVIMIIIGGLRYVTSGGSDASVSGAKNTILYAVIGLVIVAMAQVLVHFVLSNLANS
jgi:hypothetical protein